jgi:uncharacterized membrane protein (UPF0127 family)
MNTRGALARLAVRRGGPGTLIACAQLADRPLRRLCGLLGSEGLADGDGLILSPCSSVHTCFMRFPIDVLFVDRAGHVLRAFEDVQPFRFVSGGRGAVRTIELPAGTIGRTGIVLGETLLMEPV